MQWRAFVCAAALGVAALAVAAAADPAGAGASALCSKCDCQAVATIVCRCAADFKDLVVTAEAMGPAGELTKFEVRGCSTLVLKSQAFRTAHKLQTLYVEDVQSATFEMAVFEELQSLVVRNVSSFNLNKSAFQGVKALNNIMIKNTFIPKIPQWSLYDITNLQELSLENVEINAIEKEAILIDMKKVRSKFEISRCKIGHIETRGLQVGNATTITVANTEIKQAETSSIRISSFQSMVLKGNIFQPNVHVHSALILYNSSIEFVNNTLLNINILNITNLEEKPEFSPTHTLELLAFTHGGNKVLCKCLDHVTNTTGLFYQNLCLRGCSESTVSAFLESCQQNKTLSDNDRLHNICRGNVEQTTVLSTRTHDSSTPTSERQPKNAIASAQKNNTTDNKHKNGAQRNSVYFLPFLAIYLFHMMF